MPSRASASYESTKPALRSRDARCQHPTPGPDSATVSRAALVNRLRAARSFPVVSVVAPAGYGKTTLLAQWAARDGRPFAFLTLDTPETGAATLVAGIEAATATVAAEPFVLVIDDAHLLSADAAAVGHHAGPALARRRHDRPRSRSRATPVDPSPARERRGARTRPRRARVHHERGPAPDPQERRDHGRRPSRPARPDTRGLAGGSRRGSDLASRTATTRRCTIFASRSSQRGPARSATSSAGRRSWTGSRLRSATPCSGAATPCSGSSR